MEPDEEIHPLYMASQEYRHEYSGHRRQKVFNDSVHGELYGLQEVQLFYQLCRFFQTRHSS